MGELVLGFEALVVEPLSELRPLPELFPAGGVVAGGLPLELSPSVDPPTLVPTEVVLVCEVFTVTEVVSVEITVWPGSVEGGVVAGAASAKTAPAPSAINSVVNPN